ncbi:unnamed protein product [Peniophora sp. CBMAI 1063]|nr:unnamed protein product [Peniophora sp. CBMAI 1063]
MLNVSRGIDYEGSFRAEQLVMDMQAADTCRKIFTGPESLARLREASGLSTHCTPSWATWKEFRLFTLAPWGVSAEALALTLYHLAANEGYSGDDVERVRKAVKYAHDWRDDDEKCGKWHCEDEEWCGNPATARVVRRAVNLAYELEDERARATAEAQAGSLQA